MTSKKVSETPAKNDTVRPETAQIVVPFFFGFSTAGIDLTRFQTGSYLQLSNSHPSHASVPPKAQQRPSDELVQAPPLQQQQEHRHQQCCQELDHYKKLLIERKSQLSGAQKKVEELENELGYMKGQLPEMKGRRESEGNNIRQDGRRCDPQRQERSQGQNRQQGYTLPQPAPVPTPTPPPRQQQLQGQKQVQVQVQQLRQQPAKEPQNTGKGERKGNNDLESRPRTITQSNTNNTTHGTSHNTQNTSQNTQNTKPQTSQTRGYNKDNGNHQVQLPSKPVEHRTLPTASESAQPPRDVRPQGVPQPENKPKLLTVPMINDALKMLDQELGKQNSIKQPVRMAALGGALAMHRYNSRDATEAVDVILHPDHRGHQAVIHKCIPQVASAIPSLGRDWMTTHHYKYYFTEKALKGVFQCDNENTLALYRGHKLVVYGVDTKVALEMKMRRMVEQKRCNGFDLKDISSFEKELKEKGAYKSYTEVRTWNSGGKGAEIPVEMLRKELEKYARIRETSGVVKEQSGEIH